jgi:16S rRNA (guanine527-N7)-methyltransferase
MGRDEVGKFKDALEAAASSFGLEPLSRAQIEQLSKHYAMLREWNQRINLTRIIKPEEAARLHYAESLFGGRFTASASTLLDIGSGAGFPAIPLAVLKPELGVTALEASQKKSLFLSEAKDALALSNLTVARARLEEFDLTGFDLLASRALDRAEEVFPAIILALGEHQRLMLYCALDMAERLDRQCGDGYRVEIHPIPEASSRVIALFGPVGQKKAIAP